MKISDKAREDLVTGYRWRAYNVRTGKTETGNCRLLQTAKDAAETAHRTLGYHGTVTRIVGPNGGSWSLRPALKGHNMVWERLAIKRRASVPARRASV